MMTKQLANTNSLNPNAYGELPPQKPIHPDDAAKIFAQRKPPTGAVYEEKKSSALLADYPNGGTSIPEQARALRNDLDNIFQFVHDNVDFLANYGLHKTGLGALVEGSGNAFDQSDLMVKLLNAAGYADVYYVFGRIRLSAAQWSNWLGFSTSDRAGALQLLANGGIACTDFPDPNEISLEHCWVRVRVSGVDYFFDPAFKSYSYTAGLDATALPAALGYTRSTFLTRAGGTSSTSDYALALNDANINADLGTFSGNLVDWINAHPGVSLDDVLGGKRIQPTVGILRQTSLPYRDTSVGTITTNVMPTNKQAYLRVQYDQVSVGGPYNIDVTFYADALYGKRLTLWFDSHRRARLYLNGDQVLDQQSSAQAAGSEAPIVFTVVHPYPDGFANTSQTSMLKAGAQTTIGNAFGWSSKALAAAHQEGQNSLIAAGAADDSEPLLGQSLLLIWDNFIGQATRGVDLVCRMGKASQLLHHFVGTVSQFGTGSGSIKIISSFLAGTNTTSLVAGADITPTAFTTSLLIQALEGATNQQVTGIEAADVTSAIQICNAATTPIRIYDANSSNWLTGAGVRSIMAAAGYTAAELDKIESIFITPGWRVAMPETANITIGSFSNFFAYMGIAPTKRSLLSQTWFGAKGAVSSSYQTDAETNTASSKNARQVNGFGMPVSTVGDSAQVNLLNGRYEYSSDDLSVGNQGAPYELTLTRSYNSAFRLSFQGIGFGWAHNWLMSAFENSDGFIALGDQQVSAAAAAIAALYVTRDVALSDPAYPMKNIVIACITQRFLAKQLVNNVVRLQVGPAIQVFSKKPNGDYLPAIGTHGACTLTKTGSPSFFTFTTADKIVYTYRPTGEISTIIYPYGVTLTFTYHATKNYLTKVSNGFRELNFLYDSFGQMTSVNDGNSRTVSFTRDTATGNLISVEDPMSKTTTYEYDQRGRLTKIFKPANPVNAVITNVYDSLSRVKEQLDAYGNMWQFFIGGSRSEIVAPDLTRKVLFFNAKGNIVRDINALGHEILSVFDGMERVSQVTMPEGNQTLTEYDSLGNVTKITQKAKPGSPLPDRFTYFTYDPVWKSLVKTTKDDLLRITTNTYGAVGTNGAGKLVRIDQPTVAAGPSVTLMTYNSLGQLLTVTDPSNVVKSNTYEAVKNNLLSTTIDPSGLVLMRSAAYDAIGNVSSSTDAKGNVTSAVYDLNRRLTQVTGPAPLNAVSTMTYDDNGNAVQSQHLDVSDPNSQISTCIYAIDDKILAITGPKNFPNAGQPIPISYEYDNLRRVKKVTDSAGRVYDVGYDALNRVIDTAIDGQVEETKLFTNNGQIFQITDANGNISEFSYDGFDRRVRLTYPAVLLNPPTFKAFEYDSCDNATKMTTRSGGVVELTWNAQNRLLSKTATGEPPVTFTYDRSGRLLTVAALPYVTGDPSTGTLVFGYDSAGRLTQEQHSQLGTTTKVVLDKNGNSQSLVYPDLSQVTQTFDTLDRLVNVSGFGASAAISFDSASRRISNSFGNGIGQGYVYDKMDNLISTSIGGIKPNSLSIEEIVLFTFSLNDLSQFIGRKSNHPDFLWSPSALKTVSYDPANSLNQYPKIDATNFAYNADGCLSFDGTRTYSYDVESKLKTVSGSGPTVTFKYDPFGRLVEKSKVGSPKIRYVYLGLRRIEEYSAGTLARRFVYGIELDECLFTVAATTGDITYICSDERRSTILHSNSSGVPTAKLVYAPWGELSSGSLSVIGSGFAGQFFDSDTDLYYSKARHYSPKLGRFIQPDPIDFGGGYNLYAYCENDPVNFVDPYGLDGTLLYGGVSQTGGFTLPYNFNLPGYLSQTYLRPNIGGLPNGLMGSGGMSYNMQAMYYMLALIRQAQQLAAQAAQAASAVAAAAVAIPKPPPAYIPQSVPPALLIPQVGAAVGGGIILGAGVSDLPNAFERIRMNSEQVFEVDPNAKGNSLRSPYPAYVYLIHAKAGTTNHRGVVSSSGVYKWGMGEAGNLSRMNDQVRDLNRGRAPGTYIGLVVGTFRNRINARVCEASLIMQHDLSYGKLPPGNSHY